MPSDSAWISDEEWVCNRHMGTIRFSADVERCYFKNCSLRPAAGVVRKVPPKAVRPVRVIKPPRRPHTPKTRQQRAAETSEGKPLIPPRTAAELAPKPAPRCTLEGCANPARPKSKYCSRKCSNRNARRRYQKRQKTDDG